MKKCLLFTLALAIVASCALFLPSVWGWGAHRYHADVVRHIAAPILKSPGGKEVFSKRDWDEFVELYSYYPDWAGGPPRADELWEYFQAAKTKHRFDGTHSNHATVMYFKLLIESFAAGDNRKAAVWAGCLTHVIGDAVAANHPPLLCYLTYAYAPMGATIGSSGETVGKHAALLDVGGVAQDPLGKKLILDGLKDYRPTILADNAEEAAVKLQLILHDNWLTALKEEAGIARGFETWVGSNDKRGKEILARGMAKLIDKCTRDSADVIYTGLRLAEKKQTFDVDKAQEKARPSVVQFRKNITLTQASATKSLLNSTNEAPAVGVVLAVPPIYWVHGGCVDLQLCYFMNLIAATLVEEKVPYVTFDIREFPRDLDPKKVPTVIMPSYYRQADGLVTDELEKALLAYRQAGGKLLFVGGHPTKALGPLGNCLVSSPERDGFYPLKTKQLPGTELVFADKTKKPISLVKVMTDFDTRAAGYYTLKADAQPDVTPILFLDSGAARLPVGAGYKEDGTFRMIYAPWYLFLPGTFSTNNSLRKLDQPALDSAGKDLLRHLLTLLK